MAIRGVYTKDGVIDWNAPKGSKGQLVKNFQEHFNSSAYVVTGGKLVCDGIFGSKTAGAVQAVDGGDGSSFNFSTMVQVGMNPMWIVDVNDWISNIDFAALVSVGVRGCYYKMSEGRDVQADKTDRLKEAEDVGLLLGAYHYGRSDLHTKRAFTAPVKERNNFESAKAAAGVKWSLNDAYDLEHGSKTDKVHNITYFHTFADGDVFDLYTTGPAFSRFIPAMSREPLDQNHNGNLWWAEYLREAKSGGPQKIPDSMPECTIWQMTSKFYVEGVTKWDGTPAGIDLNLAWGDYTTQEKRRCTVDV
jgi:GH25 family lysozyme M1 (1,4-beta-N-acetylmuramidase)